MIRHILLGFVLLFILQPLQAQNTVGLLKYKPSRTFDGYNLMFPHNQSSVFLLNNCGEIVHTWDDDADFRPGNMAYLLDDGRIVKAKRPASVAGNTIWAGGGGAIVEILDWDNNLEWQYELNDSLRRLHHDIAVMPNGNVLMIVWELKTRDEAIAAGRDTALLSQDVLWPDYIQEINPSNDEVVWEWHVWDHLIQDFDASKANFGVVADNSGRVNLNWDTNDGKSDWMHSNALAYNEELDQIILSVPTFHEFWIIDHSTTTQQAATSAGGQGGKGGDLLYRWGNPAAYNKGTTADQKLFYQHDTHWADIFLDSAHPDFGKLVLFNNRVGSNFSTANILKPAWDMYNWAYTKNSDGVFEPADFEKTIVHPIDSSQMHSTGLSSIQLLPNGNTLICVGRYGYSYELTPDNEIVWEYRTPRIGPNPATQGDSLSINNNLTFRLNRYPVDYAAFDGRDLSSKGYMELEPDTAFCDQILSIKPLPIPKRLTFMPNPANNMVTLQWEGQRQSEIKVYDITGRLVNRIIASGGMKYLDTSDWQQGIYFLQVDDGEMGKLVVAH